MIRFHSSATGDVQMLDAHGEHLLRLIGKSDLARGVITPQQMPEAMARLRAASVADAATQRDAEPDDQNSELEREPPVALAQRAYPLLQMLQRAQAADAPVLWGV